MEGTGDMVSPSALKADCPLRDGPGSSPMPSANTVTIVNDCYLMHTKPKRSRRRIVDPEKARSSRVVCAMP